MSPPETVSALPPLRAVIIWLSIYSQIMSKNWPVRATGKQERLLGASKHELNAPRESVIGSSVKFHRFDGVKEQPGQCCGTSSHRLS